MNHGSFQDLIAKIDPVIHAPARLRLVMQLYVVGDADATFLVNQTGLTWGNLATHLRKLEESGYVTVAKVIEGRKPRTRVSLTTRGRTAFDEYRTNLSAALTDLPG